MSKTFGSKNISSKRLLNDKNKNNLVIILL